MRKVDGGSKCHAFVDCNMSLGSHTVRVYLCSVCTYSFGNIYFQYVSYFWPPTDKLRVIKEANLHIFIIVYLGITAEGFNAVINVNAFRKC